MIMNIEQMEALEHYLKSLIVIITNQEEPMVAFQEEIMIILNIRAKEIDMKIYHLKNILM